MGHKSKTQSKAKPKVAKPKVPKARKATKAPKVAKAVTKAAAPKPKAAGCNCGL